MFLRIISNLSSPQSLLISPPRCHLLATGVSSAALQNISRERRDFLSQWFQNFFLACPPSEAAKSSAPPKHPSYNQSFTINGEATDKKKGLKFNFSEIMVG